MSFVLAMRDIILRCLTKLFERFEKPGRVRWHGLAYSRDEQDDITHTSTAFLISKYPIGYTKGKWVLLHETPKVKETYFDWETPMIVSGFLPETNCTGLTDIDLKVIIDGFDLVGFAQQCEFPILVSILQSESKVINSLRTYSVSIELYGDKDAVLFQLARPHV